MGLFFFSREMFFAFFLFTACLLSNITAASVDTGIAWLKSQQRVDGGFSAANSQATEYQATVAALLALDQLSSLEAPAAQMGGEFLHSALTGHLEEIANSYRLAKIDPLYFPISTAHIIGYKSASGGYGDYPGYESTLSASAILAHALTGQDAQAQVNINELIAYLLAKQKLDKGWAEESNRSAIYVSALVSRALQAHRFNVNLSNQIHSATEFLLANQKQGGGWATNLETAMALLAVVPAVADSSRYKNALDQLVAVQLPNGSWNNDVYTTALALQVLHLIKNPPAIDVPSMGSISGDVISAASNLPLSAVQITIDGFTDQPVETDESGRFSVVDLPSGTYLLIFRTPGFLQFSRLIEIAQGNHVELGVVKLNPLSATALIAGQVTDSVTGLPLSGVLIQFTGDQNTQVSTDQNGNYSLELEPGQLNISVLQSGYHPINGTLSAVAGSHINFSPALQMLNDIPNTDIILRGLVVDAKSTLPLPRANIRISSAAISGTSNAEGRFILSGLAEGAISVEITLDGYQTVSFVGTALANSIIDFGVVHLMPVAPDHSIIYGRIVDANTGAPILNAIVAADNQSTTSDLNGAYELNNIYSESFALAVTAEGYQLANVQVNVVESGNIQLDIPLTKTQISNVEFKQLSLDKPAYGAYEEVKVNGVIRNNGVTVEEVVLQAQVVNALGIIIEEFAVSRDIAAGAEPFELSPNAEVDFTTSWFTQFYAPGQYSILVTAYATSTSQLLAQQRVTVEIQPTEKVTSLKLGTSLDNINQGSTHNIEFTTSVRNQSNIPVSLRINYDLSDPSDNVIFTDAAVINVAPNQLFATFDIGSRNQLFGSSGAYKFRILNVESVQPILIESGAINVIPDININIEQAITPAVVVPGASERVRIKIRLEGTSVEVQQ